MKTIHESPSEPAAEAIPPVKQYNYAIGYLRAFIVALVVAHHTALGYLPVVPPANRHSLLTQPRIWLIVPVLDAHHWILSTILVGINDNFFMSLMFFLSGLFFWNGLVRKGAATFLRDRWLRLGIPFLVAAFLFSPISFYPSYLQTTSHTGVAGFWQQWRALGQWPAGPAWFVWVLLVFDCLAVLLFTLRPAWAPGIGRLTERVAARPWLAALFLAFVSAVVYVPMAFFFTAGAWSALGPFAFQTSRIVHYFVYFLFGIGIGAVGVDRGLLAARDKLATHWLSACVVAIVILVLLSVGGIFAAKYAASPLWAFGFVFSCAATCFACLAIFLRFMQARRPLWDSLAANSYGIYLVHYMFVSWLQYALLPVSVPGFAKFLLAGTGALLLSWLTSATLRRIPAVARIV